MGKLSYLGKSYASKEKKCNNQTKKKAINGKEKKFKNKKKEGIIIILRFSTFKLIKILILFR